MDRRVLLKSLAAVRPGCLQALLNAATEAEIDLDALLKAATDAEIDEAWRQLESAPITFEMSEGGALWIAGMSLPTSRGEWLALTISDQPTATEILDLAEQYWVAEWVIAQAYLEANDDEDGDPELVEMNVLSDWLNESDENVQCAGNKLRDWLASGDLDEDDYARAQRMGTDPQSAALSFWRDGGLDRRKFGVVIIDGQCPGNDYYAAELRVPLEQANAAAKALGVPIRFVQSSPAESWGNPPDPTPEINYEELARQIKNFQAPSPPESKTESLKLLDGIMQQQEQKSPQLKAKQERLIRMLAISQQPRAGVADSDGLVKPETPEPHSSKPTRPALKRVK